jgi:ribosomal protein L37E
MVICDKCGKGSYETGGQPVCCWCNRKISSEARRIEWKEDRQPTEADIQAAVTCPRYPVARPDGSTVYVTVPQD